MPEKLCKIHPQYKAVRKPQVPCEPCWWAYFQRNRHDFSLQLRDELDRLEVDPRYLAVALADLARNAHVREQVAENNRLVDEENEKRLAAGCPTHGVTQYWWNDGHGGVCGICDGDA